MRTIAIVGAGQAGLLLGFGLLAKGCAVTLVAERSADEGSHASFLVRKKTFAYYLDNHHGDGIVAACFKVALGGNADLVASDPARFYLPAYIGPRGWVALRLDVGDIDWEEVAGLAADSFRLAAPKKLAAQISRV